MTHAKGSGSKVKDGIDLQRKKENENGREEKNKEKEARIQ